MVSASSDPWYFACICGAKFFHNAQAIDCPRCGEQLVSPERINPPWKKKLFTIRETAAMLSVSVSWLYERASKGEIEHHRLGGTTIRFSEDDIASLLDKSRMETQREPSGSGPRKPPDSRPRLRFRR